MMSSTVVCVVEPVNNKVLPTDKTGLPWELWQIILSWLSVVDLCHVARVCRTWNELVNSLDGTRWKELYLACNEWRHPFWPLKTKVEPPSWRQAYRDQYNATTFWKWRHKHETSHTSCTPFFKRTSLHKTIQVGAGLEHENLKSALAVANAYDRIVVHPGIYDEQFEITAKIPFELIGAGELGSIILVVGIQQVALTARLSNLVLRAPWFTSFIVMINSGYLQIDKCILEEGMICAQSPSTVHIKFCTFRHATVILQHMNTSIIENCEFSQSYSANIIIEGQPKSEKNWTYFYLREQTNAIFQQKRSMHRKKHGLKTTTSMTSTLHSSFTSKSLTTGYSTHIYDTISHDPSCNLDDPGATFLHPNLFSARYPGTDKDGMVGCGDLQSMYQEPDYPQLPSSAMRKSSLSLPASKSNYSNKTSHANSATTTTATTTTTTIDNKNGGIVIHQHQLQQKQQQQQLKTETAATSMSTLSTKTTTSSLSKNVNTDNEHIDSSTSASTSFNQSSKPLVCPPPQEKATANVSGLAVSQGASDILGGKCRNVSEEPYTVVEEGEASSEQNNAKMFASNFKCDNIDIKDAPNRDGTFEHHCATAVSRETTGAVNNNSRPHSHTKPHQEQNQNSKGKAKLSKRRNSRSTSDENHYRTKQLSLELNSTEAVCSSPQQNKTMENEDDLNSNSFPSDSSRKFSCPKTLDDKNGKENESPVKRKERSSSDVSRMGTEGTDYPTASKSLKSYSSAELNNDSISGKYPNNEPFSLKDNPKQQHNIITTSQNHNLSSAAMCSNNNNANVEKHVLHEDSSSNGEVSADADGYKKELQALPLPLPLSPSASSISGAGDEGSRLVFGRVPSPNSIDQYSLRHFRSDEDTIEGSDDDSISILDELDHSDAEEDYHRNRSDSSSSDSSSDIHSANYTGSGDEFSSSEDSVIMLPHLREFDLEPLEQSTSPRGVEAEITSINSDCTRPVPVNVSEDKMMSSFVDHIQGVLVHQCRMNHSKGGLMVTLQAHAIISECEINNVGYGIRCIHNSRVVILKNKIHHCRTSGIFMRLAASGLIAGNDIHSNNEAGIDIRKNADPLVQFNQIHHGKRSGVVVLGSGRGQIKKNDIFCNAEAGVYILYGGNPTVSENYIYEGRAAGVAVNAKGKGFIIDNVIRGNRWGGIDIRNSSCPVVSGNSIINGLSDGIVVGVGGKGNIENNNITGNSGSGIWMMSAKHLNIHGNQICCNGHCGVLMLDKSTTTMDVHLNQLMPGGITHHSFSQYEDNNFVHPEPKAPYAILQYNNISHNKSQGVVVEIQDEVRISHNAVHGNLKDGIVMLQNVPATVESNSITHNTGHGLVTSTRNKVNVTGNGIYDNTQHGVLCQNECVLEDNDVVGQAKCAVMVDGSGCVELVNNRMSSSTEPAVRGGKQSKVIAKRNRIYDKGGGDFLCEGEITTAHNSLARPTLVMECTKKSNEKDVGRTDFLCDPPPRPHAVPPPPVTTIPTHRVTVVTKVMMPSTEGCEQGSKLCMIL